MRIGFLLLGLTLGCDAVVEDDTTGTDVEEEEKPLYSDDALVISFGETGENRWYSVNDTVMGGVSSGTLTYEENSLLFEGVVSTDSNGGFTSVRSPNQTTDLSQYSKAIIRLRSEGQPFSMILAHNPYWFQDQFKVDITVDTTDWTIVEIPLSDFEVFSSQNGYPYGTGEMMTAETSTEILHMEFMSKLFEDGAFRFEVDFVAFD